MLAVSPGAVYLSRYYIHETLFVFFTLGIVVAAVRFYDERNPVYLIPASLRLRSYLTAKTAMISAGVLLIALGLTLAYMWPFRASGSLLFRNEQAIPGTERLSMRWAAVQA